MAYNRAYQSSPIPAILPIVPRPQLRASRQATAQRGLPIAKELQQVPDNANADDTQTAVEAWARWLHDEVMDVEHTCDELCEAESPQVDLKDALAWRDYKASQVKSIRSKFDEILKQEGLLEWEDSATSPRALLDNITEVKDQLKNKGYDPTDQAKARRADRIINYIKSQDLDVHIFRSTYIKSVRDAEDALNQELIAKVDALERRMETEMEALTIKTRAKLADEVEQLAGQWMDSLREACMLDSGSAALKALSVKVHNIVDTYAALTPAVRQLATPVRELQSTINELQDTKDTEPSTWAKQLLSLSTPYQTGDTECVLTSANSALPVDHVLYLDGNSNYFAYVEPYTRNGVVRYKVTMVNRCDVNAIYRLDGIFRIGFDEVVIELSALGNHSVSVSAFLGLLAASG